MSKNKFPIITFFAVLPLLLALIPQVYFLFGLIIFISIAGPLEMLFNSLGVYGLFIETNFLPYPSMTSILIAYFLYLMFIIGIVKIFTFLRAKIYFTSKNVNNTK